MATAIVSQPKEFHPIYNQSMFSMFTPVTAGGDFAHYVELKNVATDESIGSPKIVKFHHIDTFSFFDVQREIDAYMDVKLSADTVGFELANTMWLKYEINATEAKRYVTTDSITLGDGGNARIEIATHNFSPSDKIKLELAGGYPSHAAPYNGEFTVISTASTSIDINVDYSGTDFLGTSIARIWRKDGNIIRGALSTIATRTALASVFDFNEFTTYNDANYYMITSTSKFLSNMPDELTVRDDSRGSLFFINRYANFVKYLRVKTYDVGGNNIGDYRVTNAYISPSSSNLSQYLLSVGVYPYNLAQLDSGDVTVLSGSYPIISDDVSKYEVYLESTAPAQSSEQKTFNIDRQNHVECDKVQLIFMDKKGSVGSFQFPARTRQKNKVSKKAFERYNFERTYNGGYGTYAYDSSQGGATVYHIDERVSKTVTTGELTEMDADYFMQLIASPRVYEVDATYGAIPVIINDGTFETKRGVDGVLRYTISYTYANKSNSNI